jgi:hypothetical protein
MVAFLLLLLVALLLGVLGAVVEGLVFLLFVGVAVLIAALFFGAVRLRQEGRRSSR